MLLDRKWVRCHSFGIVVHDSKFPLGIRWGVCADRPPQKSMANNKSLIFFISIHLELVTVDVELEFDVV